MQLTTLLILADIAEGLRYWTGIFATIGIFALIIVIIAYISNRTKTNKYRALTEEEYKKFSKDSNYAEYLTTTQRNSSYFTDYREYASLASSCKILLFILVPLVSLSILIYTIAPTKKTLYIVAGLKATENVINSEIGKKTQELLFNKIESYLNETSKENEKK